jgi:hypothetical protein
MIEIVLLGYIVFYIILALIIPFLVWYLMTYYLNVSSAFYRIIIIVPLLVLEFFYGLMIFNNGGTIIKLNAAQIANVCPDYWQYDDATNLCLVPKNGKNVGTFDVTKVKGVFGYDVSNNGINFSDSGWTNRSGMSGFCAKQMWANTYNIWWDGVTNITDMCNK